MVLFCIFPYSIIFNYFHFFKSNLMFYYWIGDMLYKKNRYNLWTSVTQHNHQQSNVYPCVLTQNVVTWWWSSCMSTKTLYDPIGLIKKFNLLNVGKQSATKHFWKIIINCLQFTGRCRKILCTMLNFYVLTYYSE